MFVTRITFDIFKVFGISWEYIVIVIDVIGIFELEVFGMFFEFYVMFNIFLYLGKCFELDKLG